MHLIYGEQLARLYKLHSSEYLIKRFGGHILGINKKNYINLYPDPYGEYKIKNNNIFYLIKKFLLKFLNKIKVIK